MVSKFVKRVVTFVCASVLFAVPVHAAVSDGPAFETETVAMSTPEFICISNYRHFVDKDGMLCIQSNSGNIFAKETLGADTGIFVYYLDETGELKPMCHDDGTQILVNME